MFHQTPAASRAALTCVPISFISGVSGSRIPSSIKPSCCRAHFTGIGLASTNSAGSGARGASLIDGGAGAIARQRQPTQLRHRWQAPHWRSPRYCRGRPPASVPSPSGRLRSKWQSLSPHSADQLPPPREITGGILDADNILQLGQSHHGVIAHIDSGSPGYIVKYLGHVDRVGYRLEVFIQPALGGSIVIGRDQQAGRPRPPRPPPRVRSIASQVELEPVPATTGSRPRM